MKLFVVEMPEKITTTSPPSTNFALWFSPICGICSYESNIGDEMLEIENSYVCKSCLNRIKDFIVLNSLI